jgi:osmotically-inducible protein OsmY
MAFAAGVWAADKHVSDDQIYDLVRRKLADDPVVKGGAMEVEVKDGVVTLKGKVEYDEQKIKAEKLSRKVSGVKRVDNQLTVAGKGNQR